MYSRAKEIEKKNQGEWLKLRQDPDYSTTTTNNNNNNGNNNNNDNNTSTNIDILTTIVTGPQPGRG